MILIVTGGFAPSINLLQEYHRKSKFVIAADSGAKCLFLNNLKIDLIVGDFDSLDSSIKKELSFEYNSLNDNIRIYKTEKDFTDTEAAFREALKMEDEEIVIMGATGTRVDHLFSTLGLFRLAQSNHKKLKIVDDHNIIEVIDKSTIIKNNNKTLSFFAYDKEVSNFTIENVKYPLENYTLKVFDTLTVSNEFLENKDVIVDFKEGNSVIVIQSND